MGYSYEITANQLGKSKYVCPIREYGLYLVWVRRESTVYSCKLVTIYIILMVPYTAPRNS